jgi:hypothetical protein
MIELNSLPVAVSTGNEGHVRRLCRRIEELAHDGLAFVAGGHPAEHAAAAPAEPEPIAQADRDEPADKPGDDGDDEDDDEDEELLRKIAELDYYRNHTALGVMLFSGRRDS